MLFQTHSGGNGYNGSNGSYGGYGFGAALTKGTDFNCNAAICYAIGAARHAQFQNLQTQLNLFSTPVGFSTLTVDGFIGPATASAAQLTAKAIIASGLPGNEMDVTSQVAAGVSKETLATLVEDFNLALAAAGPVLVTGRLSAGLPLSPVAKPSTPSTAAPTPAAIHAATVAIAPGAAAAAALPTPKKAWLPWILGGVAAVLVVGGVGYVIYRRKARASEY